MHNPTLLLLLALLLLGVEDGDCEGEYSFNEEDEYEYEEEDIYSPDIEDPDLSNVPKWSQDVLTTTASPTMTTLKPTTLSPTHRPAATTTALPLPPSRPPQTSTSTTAPSTQSSTTTTSTQEPTKTSFPPEVPSVEGETSEEGGGDPTAEADGGNFQKEEVGSMGNSSTGTNTCICEDGEGQSPLPCEPPTPAPCTPAPPTPCAPAPCTPVPPTPCKPSPCVPAPPAPCTPSPCQPAPPTPCTPVPCTPSVCEPAPPTPCVPPVPPGADEEGGEGGQQPRYGEEQSDSSMLLQPSFQEAFAKHAASTPPLRETFLQVHTVTVERVRTVVRTETIRPSPVTATETITSCQLQEGMKERERNRVAELISDKIWRKKRKLMPAKDGDPGSSQQGGDEGNLQSDFKAREEEPDAGSGAAKEEGTAHKNETEDVSIRAEESTVASNISAVFVTLYDECWEISAVAACAILLSLVLLSVTCGALYTGRRIRKEVEELREIPSPNSTRSSGLSPRDISSPDNSLGHIYEEPHHLATVGRKTRLGSFRGSQSQRAPGLPSSGRAASSHAGSPSSWAYGREQNEEETV